MAQTSPTPITTGPAQAPQRGNRNTFSTLFDAFVVWILNAVAQFNAIATNVYNNAVDAYNNATAAAGSAQNAAISADAAQSGSNAPVWVSGTSYTAGNCRYSPIDFKTYRRKTSGAGTTDPSLDATNWTRVSQSPVYFDLLQTIIPSGSSAVIDLSNFVTTQYDSYLIDIQGLGTTSTAAGASTVTLQMCTSTVLDSATHYYRSGDSTGSAGSSTNAGTAQVYQNGSGVLSGQIEIINARSPYTYGKQISFTGMSVNVAATVSAFDVQTMFLSSSISGLKLTLTGGGNFVGSNVCLIQVYGRKNS